MSSNADKKNKKNLEQKFPIFVIIFVISTLIKLLSNGYKYWIGEFKSSNFITILLFFIFNLFAVKGVYQAMKFGLSYSYYY